jgi:hypothetical protein
LEEPVDGGEAQRDGLEAGAQDRDWRGTEPQTDDGTASVVGPTRVALATPQRQHGEPMAVRLELADFGLGTLQVRKLQRRTQPVEQAATVVEGAAHGQALLVDAVAPQAAGNKKIGRWRPNRALGT